MTEEVKAERSKQSKRITRSFLAMTGLFFAVVFLGSFGLIANSHRIKDIQDSRIASCKQTYTGMHEVFQPLFTDPPQTPRRKRRTTTFNNKITELKDNCNIQTKP